MAEEKAAVEVKQEGDFKIKSKPKKPKNLGENKTEPVKVDLTKDPNVKVEDPIKVEIKNEDNAVQTQETDDSNVVVEEPKDSADSQEVVEEVRETDEKLSTPLQEITEDELDEKTTELYEKAEEAVKDQVKEGKPLPENIESLVNFCTQSCFVRSAVIAAKGFTTCSSCSHVQLIRGVIVKIRLLGFINHHAAKTDKELLVHFRPSILVKK